MMLGWLTPFDMENPYALRRVDVVHAVACGERDDYLWVRLDPPLEPGEAANAARLDHVLLAPRHEGHPLTIPIEEPVHVNVCTVRDATTDVPPRIHPGDVEIRHWGIVAPS